MPAFILSILLTAFLAFPAFAHHLAPDEMSDFITDQLVSVDSPHLLSSEDDPSLLDLVELPSDMTDVDYVAVITSDDIAAILVEIEDILLMLEDGNEVIDYTVIIEFDMDTGLYTVTLYVDFVE